jgi:hypothetical protein
MDQMTDRRLGQKVARAAVVALVLGLGSLAAVLLASLLGGCAPHERSVPAPYDFELGKIDMVSGVVVRWDARVSGADRAEGDREIAAAGLPCGWVAYGIAAPGWRDASSSKLVSATTWPRLGVTWLGTHEGEAVVFPSALPGYATAVAYEAARISAGTDSPEMQALLNAEVP